MNTGFLEASITRTLPHDFFGDCAKTYMTASALMLSVELLFLPHDLSTHLAPFDIKLV